jgi:uncharacterized membrane protein SpoIIM required for sporulation
MVLESIFGSAQVMRKPYLMLFLGIVLSWCSTMVVDIFFSDAGLLAIAFITIAVMPVIHNVFIQEESEEARVPILSERFLERNIQLIAIYTFFTLGVVIGYASMYILLPPDRFMVCASDVCVPIAGRTDAFAEQEKTLSYIAQISEGSGKVLDIDSSRLGDFFYWFSIILVNNLSVLVAAVIFSFIFGAGAVFLISWNASVVGTWVGKTILASDHFKFFGLLPHGIPEFVGYFLGAIAGGLISIAVTKRKHFTHEIERIAADSAILLAAAVISLVFGAAIEASSKAGMNFFALTLSMVYMIALVIAVIKVE